MHVTGVTGLTRGLWSPCNLPPAGLLLRVPKPSPVNTKLLEKPFQRRTTGPKTDPEVRGRIAGYHQQEGDQQCQPIASHRPSIAMVWCRTTLPRLPNRQTIFQSNTRNLSVSQMDYQCQKALLPHGSLVGREIDASIRVLQYDA